MIHVFIGTKAQLIKMAPVMAELQRRNIEYNFIFSGQHQATVTNIREEFGLKAPDITLYEGKDITGILQMLFWSLRIVRFTLTNRDKVWRGDRNGIILNHGDTFSTLLGSLLGRLSGQRSAHVESGLRSFNLLHPFPEEITRLLTFRLSSIFFAPGEWALSNLKKYPGKKINTVHNSLLDALRISEQAVENAQVEVPEHTYALVSIHRFENIFSRSKLEAIVDLLLRLSERIPLLFILHKPTEQKLTQYGLMEKLKRCDAVDLRPRYSYFEFMKLTRHADLVVTDGGSNQEECHYLGKPCILMRAASERQEGIGGNVVISNYQFSAFEQVLNDIEHYRVAPPNLDVSPSRIIVDTLAELSA